MKPSPCKKIVLLVALGELMAPMGSTAESAVAPAAPFKAVAFDAFVVLDPGSVCAKAEKMFPEKGSALCKEWRRRQFEYCWLRVASGRYADFWQITSDALTVAAKITQVDLTSDQRGELMNAYLTLDPWPDAVENLQALKKAGLRLVFLSNLTPAMLEANMKHAGLDGLFEPSLSTDRVNSFKPDPRAYQMGVDALGLKREEILFAAFGGWDAAGAKSFGYTTYWVNRADAPQEELNAAPDAQSETLAGLLRFISAPVSAQDLPKNAVAGDSLDNALRHLSRGMKVTVYLKTGETVSGHFNDYDAGRLSLRAGKSRSFRLAEIRALSTTP